MNQVAHPASVTLDQRLVQAERDFETDDLLSAAGLRKQEHSLFGDWVYGRNQQERHQSREEQDWY